MIAPLTDPANYQFNLTTIPLLITGLAILVLGTATLLRERGTRVSCLFAFLTVTISVWLVTISFTLAADTAELARVWIKIEHVGVHLIPAILFHLAIAVCGSYRRYRHVVWAGWFFSGVFVLATVTSDVLIGDLYQYQWGYYPRYGLANVAFLIFFAVMLGAGLRQYWVAYRASAPGTADWRRARLLLLAFSIGYLAIVDFVPAYGVGLHPFGYLPVMAFLLLSARAISRYRLVKITPAFAAKEIIETMGEALLVLDRAGTVRVANEAAGALFEWPAADLIGQPVEAIVKDVVLSTPDEERAVEELMHRREVIYRTQAGDRKNLSVSSSVMHSSAGEVMATICVIRDVTERKKAEQRIQREAARNARLYQKAQQRLSQVQALRAIDRAITTSSDLQSTLEMVLEQIVDQLTVDAADILLFDPQRQRLELAASRGFMGGVDETPLLLNEAYAGQAVLEQKTISLPRLAASDDADRRCDLFAREAFISYFAVPLTAKDQVKAVLEIFHRSLLKPELEWLNFLETLAGQAALAIDNASLFAETRRQAAQLTTLNAIISAAAGASQLSELQETALDYVLKALDVEHGAIWVLDHYTIRGFEATDASAQNPLVRLAREEKGTLVVEDWQQVADDRTLAARQQIVDAAQIRASLTVPVMAEGRWVGGLSLASNRAHFWSEEEVKLVEAVGQQLGVSAERLRLLNQSQMHAQRVQQIMDTVPEGLLLLDNEHRVKLANATAVDYLKVIGDGATVTEPVPEGAKQPLSQLGGRPIEALLVPAPKGLPAHEVTVETPEPHTFEVVARRTPPTPGADGGGWLLVVRDVTVERQIKARIQQQDRLAAVGQLAAGIAHDFNNIMLVIALYAQMIERNTDLSEKEQERLHTIRQQALHATNLIEQILDFSRRSVLEMRPLEMLPFVQEFIQLLRRTLPENIQIEFEGDAEALVTADSTHLQQVLMNLAVNARDAMPEGGLLKLSLSTLSLSDDSRAPLPEMEAGYWLVLQVADTGSGIPQGALAHLFEPFFTTKAPGRGTGLGLAQVYGIVKQHGGHIAVESEAGKGTCFTIYLPAMTPNGDVHPVGDQSVELSFGSETILLVEDDQAAREALQDILVSYGYRVLVANDGRAALELFEQHEGQVDLVLSDMIMPQMGSVALYQALKERQASFKMIVITGYPLEDDGKALLEQGILSWLAKPFSMEEVVAKVRAALDGA